MVEVFKVTSIPEQSRHKFNDKVDITSRNVIDFETIRSRYRCPRSPAASAAFSVVDRDLSGGHRRPNHRCRCRYRNPLVTGLRQNP